MLYRTKINIVLTRSFAWGWFNILDFLPLYDSKGMVLLTQIEFIVLHKNC